MNPVISGIYAGVLAGLLLKAPGLEAWAQPGQEEFPEALIGNRFDRAADAPAPLPGRVPWWSILEGQPRIDAQRGLLELPAGSQLDQPLAGLPGALAGLRIEARFRGSLGIELIDATGRVLTVRDAGIDEQPQAADREAWQELRWQLPPQGADCLPRLSLRLSAGAAPADVQWVSARVPLPVFEPVACRARLLERLVQGFEPWLSGALDVLGSRATAFVVGVIDAQSGQLAGQPSRKVGLHPLYTQMLRAQALEPRPEWEAALLRFLGDYLELCIQPRTGLPRVYDPLEDRPLDQEPIEIAAHLEFLLDWVEFGPEAGRERARDAARTMAFSALEHGVLPDGSVAAKYIPGTGQPVNSTVELRRLDVPARWVRAFGPKGLIPTSGADAERAKAALAAARDAVWQLELYHHWAGTWDRIDPGFDDEYGHYGARAVEMWEAAPGEAAFSGLALSGLRDYAELWEQALCFGGNIAADQVRCWQIVSKIAELNPDRAPRIEQRLLDAAHLHFIGQQNSAGVWVDTTVVGFDPQNLPVGDTLGVPQNLLVGLGLVAEHSSGLDRELCLRRLLAVLTRTEQQFLGPAGFVDGAGSAGRSGAGRSATGTFRVAPGLIAGLRALGPAGSEGVPAGNDPGGAGAGR